LIDQHREYLAEGDIYRITSKSSRRLYHLFLFTDALVYSSRTGSNKFKVRRVLQLAFCDVRNLDDTRECRYAYSIESPQKTVVFAALSSASKDIWMDEIGGAIARAKQQRLELIDSTFV
jgi:hypothetical protein